MATVYDSTAQKVNKLGLYSDFKRAYWKVWSTLPGLGSSSVIVSVSHYRYNLKFSLNFATSLFSLKDFWTSFHVPSGIAVPGKSSQQSVNYFEQLLSK